MRIFVGALATETNTFIPAPTGLAAFELEGIRRGPGSDANPGGVLAMLDVIRARAGAGRHEVVEGLCAVAQPGGVTVRSAYETLRDELLRDVLAASPCEVILLLLHGAMVADGYDDCEGDLLARVREIVGPTVAIGVEMDLHGHLTERMRAAADVVVAFKEYPHVDAPARAAEVCDLAVRTALGRIRPTTGVFDCRMVGLWHTTDEPMRYFVGRLGALEGRGTVLSASFGHGFPWSDVPEAGARVWVVTDGDPSGAATHAAALGREVWALRAAAIPPRLAVDDAIDRASAGAGPVVVADAADNPGGGAPGDGTFLLRRLLDRDERDAALGCLWDPGAVQICRDAGVGASFALRLGGKGGPGSGEPVEARVVVRAFLADHGQDEFGRRASFGPSVLLTAGRGIDVVVTTNRRQVVGTEAFTELGVELASKRLVVVKSAQHFRAAFGAIAREVLYVDTPGALTSDFARIPYRRRDPHYWPRVADPFAER